MPQTNTPPQLDLAGYVPNLLKVNSSVNLFSPAATLFDTERGDPGDYAGLSIRFWLSNGMAALFPTAPGPYTMNVTNLGGMPVYEMAFTTGATRQNVEDALHLLGFTTASAHLPATVGVDVQVIDFDGDTTVTSNTTIIVEVEDRNTKPAAVNTVLNLAEDEVRVLSLADFGASDSNGDAIGSVTITSLPGAGTLEWNNNPVVLATKSVFTAADLLTGGLRYHGAPNAYGDSVNPYAIFQYRVTDSYGAVSDNTADMSLFVAPVNDPPVISLSANSTHYVEGQAGYPVLAAASTTVSDVDNDGLPNFGGLTFTVEIENPQAGESLGVDPSVASFINVQAIQGGLAVSFKDTVTSADYVKTILNNITYSNSSQNPAPTASILWEFSQDGAVVRSYAREIQIDPVNDAPVASNSTVFAPLDQPLRFVAGNFPFTDADDPTGTASIAFSNMAELHGQLTWNGVPIVLSAYYPIADIDKLRFTWNSEAAATGPDPSFLDFVISDSHLAYDSASRLTFLPNYRPEFQALGSQVAEIYPNGAPVVLDPDVGIADANLAQADPNAFANTRLVLHREGNTNALDYFDSTDRFHAFGTLAFDNGVLRLGGTAVGTVQNEAGSGVLTIDFGSANISKSVVDSVMRQIAYSNVDVDTRANAMIQWDFYEADQGANTMHVSGVSQIALLNNNGSVQTPNWNLSEDAQLAMPGISDPEGLDLNAPISYQWLWRGAGGDVPIAGAVGTTYTLGQADVSYTMGVQISYTDGTGRAETATYFANTPVANVNDLPTGNGVIVLDSGMQGSKWTVGQVLKANTDAIGDADNLSGLGNLTYVWRAMSGNVAEIRGTGSLYEVQAADRGKTIELIVGYTDSYGTVESVQSLPVLAVNRLPVASAASIAVARTQAHTFAAQDFGIVDADGDAMGGIRIARAPAGGVLLLNGMQVDEFSQDPISVSDLASLVFQPFEAAQQMSGDSFDYIANDGLEYSLPATITLQFQATPPSDTGSGTITPPAPPPEQPTDPVPPVVTPPVIIDGTPVVLDPDGNPATSDVTVPPVPPNRDGDGNAANDEPADIPLADGGGNDLADLVIAVTDGIGLISTGPAGPVSIVTEDDRALVIDRLSERLPVGTPGYNDALDRLDSFLDALNGGTGIELREIVLTGPGNDQGNKVTITGGPRDHAGDQVIVVLDTRQLDFVPNVTLRNVDALMVYGPARIQVAEGRVFMLGDDASQVMLLGAGDDLASGGPGDDTVVGGPGKDTVDGGYGNDLVAGAEHDDLVVGGPGNDILQGGVPDNGQWAFTVTDKGVVAAWHQSTVYGDTAMTRVALPLLNMASNDLGFLHADATRLADIALLYHAAFGKAEPDMAGLSYWANDPISVDAMAQAFTGFMPAQDDTAFVTGIAKTALNLADTDARVTAWIADLAPGMDGAAAAKTRGEVLDEVAFDAQHRDAQSAGTGLQIGSAEHKSQGDWFANSGNDVLRGGPGNDVITGGDGIDTVVYAGTAGHFQVSAGGTGTRVTDTSGAEGTDNMAGIERLRFADYTVDLRFLGRHPDIAPADTDDLIALYQAYFERTPEASGLRGWMAALGNGATLSDVSSIFASVAVSPAYAGMTGMSASLDDTGWVNLALHNVTGRGGANAPSPDEVAVWTAKLGAGEARPAVMLQMIDATQALADTDPQVAGRDLLANRVTLGHILLDRALEVSDPAQLMDMTRALSAAVTPDGIQAALVGLPGVEVNGVQLA